MFCIGSPRYRQSAGKAYSVSII